MSILSIAAGRAGTWPVVVATSSVSGTSGRIPHSAATSDETIDMLEPVSSHIILGFPLTCTVTIGVPDADTSKGSITGLGEKVIWRCLTLLNAVAQDSTSALFKSSRATLPCFFPAVISARIFHLSWY